MDLKILDKPFWALSKEEVFAQLETTQTGLNKDQVSQRIKDFGPNQIQKQERLSSIKIFLRQFKNPLIFILVIAGAISTLLADFKDAAFIILAALVNAGLGFYQENKAEQALEHLKGYITKRVRVVRAGREKEIDADEIVPGDIIYISQGDRIAADARLIYASDLQTDEALLTGESLPVDKKIEALSADKSLAERSSMIYSGTLVTQGFGRATVTATGASTEIGKIASLVSSQKTSSTPLQKALRSFIIKAAVLIILLVIGLFFVAQTSGLAVLDAFLISIAVLVSAVPEGLPIVMTVILAVGVQRLAKKKGIVRRISAAETLGSTSVILTDKTGTLTQAKMALSRIRMFSQELNQDQTRAEKFLLSVALLNLESAVENPDENPEKWNIIGRPLENAVIAGAAKNNILYPDIRAGEDPLFLLPFNSKNKFSASLYQLSEKHSWAKGHFKAKKPYVFSMVGAPEYLLQYSRLSQEKQQEVLSEIEAMTNMGERVVAVAVKEVDDVKDLNIHDRSNYKDLRFLGTISFRDPVRPSVKKAIRDVRRAGIKVVVLTGDHQGTATAVASELGMNLEAKNILNGPDIDNMDINQVKARLADLKLVARVSPEGKLKIARAFQEVGETIAMNGDGINDAPALKEANIGIAMGSGTDVTKDVADLVLLDDNFETISEAVKEGRLIIRNIRKAIVYLTSAIFDEIFLIGGALLVGLALPMNALQILWVNFFTDSFPGISLAFEKGIDPPEPHPVDIKRGVFNPEMKFLVFVAGILSSVGLFALYWLLLKNGYDEATVRTFIFATFGTYSLFLGLSMRSLRKSIFEYNPLSNPYMIASIILGVVLMAVAIYVPFFQGLFHTVDLNGYWLILSLAFSAANIFLIELSKLLYRHVND